MFFISLPISNVDGSAAEIKGHLLLSALQTLWAYQ